MIKNKVKKLALCVATLGVFSGAALAATPEDTYKEALQYSNQHIEGTYMIDFQLDMPFVGATKTTSVAQVREYPYEMKMDTTLKTAVVKNVPSAFTIYQLQDGKALLTYYPGHGENLWFVRTFPLDSDAPYMDKVLSKTHENVMSGVKSVRDLGDNRYRVVYDMTKLYKPGDVKEWKGVKKDDVAVIIKALKALQETGDFKATITIDPKTKRITNVSAPLTPQMQAIVDVALDYTKQKMPKNSREINMLQAFFKNSDANIDVSWKELPKDADLSVPKDIKEKAKPAPAQTR